MLRKNIFEILEGRINYSDEILSIEMILEGNAYIEDSEREFGEPSKRTILNIINLYFLKWDYRGTANSLFDLQKRVGVLWGKNNIPSNPTMKDFLLYCEAVYNACDNALYYNEYSHAERPLNAILENIEKSLSRIGYKIYTYPDEIKSIVVINNENACAAANLVDEFSAIKIMEYNNHLLSGDLDGKKLILKNLADVFEKNRKSLKEKGFTALESDIGFLLNNLDIRHNNKKDEKSSKFMKGMTKKRLEKWYDKTYELILTSLMNLESVKIGKEIEDLKSSVMMEKGKENGKDEDAK